jgi:hypothetical protein
MDLQELLKYVKIPSDGKLKEIAKKQLSFSKQFLPSDTNLTEEEIYKGLKKEVDNDKYLLENCKEQKDLMIPLTTKVKSVRRQLETSFIQVGGGFVGGPVNYRKTQSTRLEIIIENPEVEKIIYFAEAPIRSGDNITAYIDKGKENSFSVHSFEESHLLKNEFYTERKWEKEEITKKIKINYKNGNKDICEII